MKREFAQSAQKSAYTEKQATDLAIIMRLTDIVGPVHEDEAGNRFCYRIERSDLIGRQDLYFIYQATEGRDGKIAECQLQSSSDTSQLARLFLELESTAKTSSDYPRLSQDGLLSLCLSEGVMPFSDAINGNRTLRQRLAQAAETCPTRHIHTPMVAIAAAHKMQLPKPARMVEHGGKPQLPRLRN
jgi:hypothetical protein